MVGIEAIIIVTMETTIGMLRVFMHRSLQVKRGASSSEKSRSNLSRILAYLSRMFYTNGSILLPCITSSFGSENRPTKVCLRLMIISSFVGASIK